MLIHYYNAQFRSVRISGLTRIYGISIVIEHPYNVIVRDEA